MVALVDLEVGTLYAIVVASAILSLLAVVFAFRLSRITGLFSAWALLIAGLIFTAVEDFIFFGAVVFDSYSQLQTSAEGYSWSTYALLVLILLVIPGLFFGSMFKLHSMFRAQKLKSEAAGGA